MRKRCRWQMKRPNEGAAVEILRAYSELKISGTAIGQGDHVGGTRSELASFWGSREVVDEETPFTPRASLSRRRAHEVTPLRKNLRFSLSF